MALSTPPTPARRGRRTQDGWKRWAGTAWLLLSVASACAEDVPRARPGTAAVPEACQALAGCCGRLPVTDQTACQREAAAASKVESGGVRCGRAEAALRDRGFCGGNGEGGASALAPGCALFASCCAAIAGDGDRAACEAELASYAQSSEGEDACVAAHDENVLRGLCPAAPVVIRGPSCAALVACCSTLGPDARDPCLQSADQIFAGATPEPGCAASRAAYLEAGLCREPANGCLLALPAESSCCACPQGKTCQPNGCYNGYLCDPSTCRCGKRPTSGSCATP